MFCQPTIGATKSEDRIFSGGGAGEAIPVAIFGFACFVGASCLVVCGRNVTPNDQLPRLSSSVAALCVGRNKLDYFTTVTSVSLE